MAKKKVTVERKPMKVKRTRKITEEQREALRERMKEMRKKRKPAEYKNVSERVLTLPDDDTYSFKIIYKGTPNQQFRKGSNHRPPVTDYIYEDKKQK